MVDPLAPVERPDLQTAVGARLAEQAQHAEQRRAASPAGQAAAARTEQLDRLVEQAEAHPVWFGEQPDHTRSVIAAHAQRVHRGDA